MLAERLNKFVYELDDMPVEEFDYWQTYIRLTSDG